jgi:maltokinase
MTFEETLAEWMPAQRWFAGKGARILDLAIVADTELADGIPGLRHLIIDVSQGSSVDSYQVFVGLRQRVPDRLEHAVIGRADASLDAEGLTAYDALHDPDLTRLLLAGMSADEHAGPLRFAREPGAAIDTDLDSLVLTGEQSNTSLMFAETSILKVFRRLSPGPNPDLEVPRALARLGSPHVAEPLGAGPRMESPAALHRDGGHGDARPRRRRSSPVSAGPERRRTATHPEHASKDLHLVMDRGPRPRLCSQNALDEGNH